MFRAKVLIFMVPLVLPIGQPPARATDGSLAQVDCAPLAEDTTSLDQPPALLRVDDRPDRDASGQPDLN